MASTTVTLRNAKDTHADSDWPSRNFFDAKRLRLQDGSALAYLYFNRAFPLDATIVSATLRVYTKGAWNIAPTLTVKKIAEHRPLSKLTWDNRPTAGSANATKTQSSAADGHEWAFDVTALLQGVADGGVWYGFRIETSSSAAGKYLHSANAVDFQPELEVTWSEAPQAPSVLTPTGSQAVSIGKPMLRFDFTDTAGSTVMQALQVQVDPAGNWATPAFDSGVVTASEPELDLATTAYAGLSAGTETRWRVKVQDGAGLWSPWSDVVRFRRDNKGTLSITNPPVSGVVNEWTPPITWSLTGETQKAWRVFITPDDDPTTDLYDTGRVKGTDTSWTLPKAVIEDESDYRVYVRIWDTKDRVSVPGDRPFTETWRTFHFAEDPTPNPVTGLTVANLLPRPWAELTWSRATMPDRFVIKRNGKVVEVIEDPSEILDSGTTYVWTDRDAHPYRLHEWKVQAVVNGKTSGGPTVSLRTQSQGIWIYDHDRNIEVFLAGTDEAGFVHGEEGTTHYPLGSSRGKRTTQALRGYEGPVSGVLIDFAGKTAQGWENELMRIKGRPARNVTVTLGNEAIRCIVHSITSVPTSSTPPVKRVSFHIEQQGRLGFDVRW